MNAALVPPTQSLTTFGSHCLSLVPPTGLALTYWAENPSAVQLDYSSHLFATLKQPYARLGKRYGSVPLFDGAGGYVYSPRAARRHFSWDCVGRRRRLAWSNLSLTLRPAVGWHANGGVGRRILADVDALPVPPQCQ